MFMTGIEGKPVAFTMTDSQILQETFMEDLNNILNTGEIPNLMLPEDKDKVQNEIRTNVQDPKKVETND
jgi:dynein heavy chain, axonemal